MASNEPRRRRQSAQPKANLTKYYSSGPQPAGKASPFKKRSVGKPWRRGVLGRLMDLAVLILLAGVLFYGLVVKPEPKVVVSDTAYRQASAYQKAIDEQFSSLKNRNKLTLDEQGIEQELKKKFPEIANVNLQLPLLGQIPRVEVEVSGPAFLLSSPSGSFIIDAKGRAAGRPADLPQIKNLTGVQDQSGFEIKAGQQVLSASEVAFIDSVIKQTKKAGVPIASLSLPPRAQELDLRTSDQSYYVKFYLGGDPASQIGQFLAARAQFERSGTKPSEYLDARVQGKVFYK